jgi:hypothetical protein
MENPGATTDRGELMEAEATEVRRLGRSPVESARVVALNSLREERK